MSKLFYRFPSDPTTTREDPSTRNSPWSNTATTSVPTVARPIRSWNGCSRRFADSMRLVFRNLPLADVHPHAEAAAEMAEAVALQGKFWEIHDALFENQRDLSSTRASSLRERSVPTCNEATAAIAERRTPSTGRRRLRRRHSKRRERHADVLRERRALRRLVDVRTFCRVPDEGA